ncbi:MAG TPA: galactose-1-phosphate uridylyltransferase [Syntrophorhabdaceae bacterium]|nr:galactose-1-phosphate uridylyltransferase [Syntrophorhabdaceae bacterium]HQM80756.1 galactose-1-phosphate uridylyltransferase [Syntrophorhabdaceae bacterium]
MPELRKDPIIDRWVIISTERGKRPVFFVEEAPPVKAPMCPLCPGNETMTPPEVYSVRQDGFPLNGPNWTLRVVPNKFPALRVEGNLDKEGIGLYDKMNGVGAHEVIIETPNHGETLSRMDIGGIQRVLVAYRARILDLIRDQRLKYIMVFKNHGSVAGASLDHSHSQLIALPIIPRRVVEEINGGLNYYKFKDRCVFCDIIAQEKEDNVRVVFENDRCIALSPYASRFPFETWILPKKHEPYFASYERTDDYFALAETLSTVLKKYDRVLNSPPYNYIIHTAPFGNGQVPHYHWHVEIIPRLTKMAGFEWGTGFYINPTPPEEATEYLKDRQI